MFGQNDFDIQKTIADIIKTRKAKIQTNESSAHRNDILQILLNNSQSSEQQEDNEMMKPLSEEEMISNSIIFIFAGHETTAITLSFALYLLAKNHAVQQQAQQWIDLVLPNGRAPTFSDVVESLQPIDNIFKETLRLYPVAGGIIRKLRRDFTFEGMELEKGQLTFYSFVAVQRNPKYWDNPDDFIPERFSDPVVQEKLRQNPHMWTPYVCVFFLLLHFL